MYSPLTRERVEEIRAFCKDNDLHPQEQAKRLNVSISTIKRITRGYQYKFVKEIHKNRISTSKFLDIYYL